LHIDLARLGVVERVGHRLGLALRGGGVSVEDVNMVAGVRGAALDRIGVGNIAAVGLRVVALGLGRAVGEALEEAGVALPVILAPLGRRGKADQNCDKNHHGNYKALAFKHYNISNIPSMENLVWARRI